MQLPHYTINGKQTSLKKKEWFLSFVYSPLIFTMQLAVSLVSTLSFKKVLHESAVSTDSAITSCTCYFICDQWRLVTKDCAWQYIHDNWTTVTFNSPHLTAYHQQGTQILCGGWFGRPNFEPRLIIQYCWVHGVKFPPSQIPGAQHFDVVHRCS